MPEEDLFNLISSDLPQNSAPITTVSHHACELLFHVSTRPSCTCDQSTRYFYLLPSTYLLIFLAKTVRLRGFQIPETTAAARSFVKTWMVIATRSITTTNPGHSLVVRVGPSTMMNGLAFLPEPPPLPLRLLHPTAMATNLGSKGLFMTTVRQAIVPAMPGAMPTSWIHSAPAQKTLSHFHPPTL